MWVGCLFLAFFALGGFGIYLGWDSAATKIIVGVYLLILLYIMFESYPSIDNRNKQASSSEQLWIQGCAAFVILLTLAGMTIGSIFAVCGMITLLVLTVMVIFLFAR